MARTRRTADERLELRRLPEQIDAKMRAVDPSTTFTGRGRREQLMLEARDRNSCGSLPRDRRANATTFLARPRVGEQAFCRGTADPELWRTRR